MAEEEPSLSTLDWDSNPNLVVTFCPVYCESGKLINSSNPGQKKNKTSLTLAEHWELVNNDIDVGLLEYLQQVEARAEAYLISNFIVWYQDVPGAMYGREEWMFPDTNTMLRYIILQVWLKRKHGSFKQTSEPLNSKLKKGLTRWFNAANPSAAALADFLVHHLISLKEEHMLQHQEVAAGLDGWVVGLTTSTILSDVSSIQQMCPSPSDLLIYSE
uniref:Uncharacterized protein n=1 Tax=Timema monikensis TaxID=170555 RepID=A0A7R9EK95_9NEOP|nr:unnamed protein product [Timema monikensis]